jgi:hypothetical protein
VRAVASGRFREDESDLNGFARYETKLFGMVFSLALRAKNICGRVYFYRCRIPSPRSAFADSFGATASAYAPLRRDHRYRTAAKLPSEAGPELPSGGGEARTRASERGGLLSPTLSSIVPLEEREEAPRACEEE